MGLTEDERFAFDLYGWFVRQSILAPDETTAIAEQVRRISTDAMSLSPEQRAIPGGPSSVLIDHPAIVDVIEDVIGPMARFEAGFSIYRQPGEGEQELHHGDDDRIFGYRVENGRIHAGAVRVVIELTPVDEGDGGTAFISGSHKSNFRPGGNYGTADNGPLREFVTSYSCPAGSAVFFTEAITHGGRIWRRPDPRVAVLNLYNHVGVNYTRWATPSEVLDSLPPEKQAWLRPVWCSDFSSIPPRANTREQFLDQPEPLLNFPTRAS